MTKAQQKYNDKEKDTTTNRKKAYATECNLLLPNLSTPPKIGNIIGKVTSICRFEK